MKTCCKCKIEKSLSEFSKHKASADGNYPHCKECQAKVDKDKYDKRKNAGMCVGCGHYPAMPGILRCNMCTWKSIAYIRLGSSKRWVELKDLWLKQGKKCALTGRPISIGDNLSVDHILPVSKYPELAHDIDNIQLVHHNVNMAKWDLTHSEFIQLCQDVVDAHNSDQCVEETP